MTDFAVEAERSSVDVKRGQLLLYATGCLCGSSWSQRTFILGEDGSLCWYKHDYSASAEGYINIATGNERIVVGSKTRMLPDCPPVPKGGNYDYVIAISTRPDPYSPHVWIYCQTRAKFISWVDAFMCVLDPVPSDSSST